MRYFTFTSKRALRPRSFLYALLLILALLIVGVGIGVMFASKGPSVAVSLILGIAVLIATFIRPEIGLLFLIFMAPLPWFHLHIIPMRAVTLENLVFAIVFLAWIFQMSIGRRKIVGSPMNIVISIYIVVNLIACLRSFYVVSGEAAHWSTYWAFVYIKGILIYYLTVNIIKTEKHIKQCILVMSISVIIVLVMAVSGKFIEEVGPFRRIYTPATGDPNTTGSFIALFTPIFLGLMIVSNSKAYKIFLAALSGLCMYAIMMTYSRGSYLAITAGLLCLFAIKDRKALIILIIALLLSPLWVPEPVKYRVFDFTFQPGGVIYTSGRDIRWRASFQEFLQHPVFGMGYGVISYRKGISPHSFFLKTATDAGVIGLGILIWLLVMAFRYGWYVFRNGTSKFLQGLGLGFIATTTVVVVHGTVGWSLLLGPLKYYFFALLGLIVVSKEILIEKPPVKI